MKTVVRVVDGKGGRAARVGSTRGRRGRESRLGWVLAAGVELEGMNTYSGFWGVGSWEGRGGELQRECRGTSKVSPDRRSSPAFKVPIKSRLRVRVVTNSGTYEYAARGPGTGTIKNSGPRYGLPTYHMGGPTRQSPYVLCILVGTSDVSALPAGSRRHPGPHRQVLCTHSYFHAMWNRYCSCRTTRAAPSIQFIRSYWNRARTRRG